MSTEHPVEKQCSARVRQDKAVSFTSSSGSFGFSGYEHNGVFMTASSAAFRHALIGALVTYPSSGLVPVTVERPVCARWRARCVAMASVTMPFAYQLERALDPEKRGPAEMDFDAGGMSALDAMCNPTVPPPPMTDAAAALRQTADLMSTAAKTAATAGMTKSTTSGVAAAAVAAAAAGSPDPASSIEPLLHAMQSSL